MVTSTTRFTLICWADRTYKRLAEGLASDCRQLGYPFHLYDVDEAFDSPIQAWCNHPRIIRQGVEDFGTVLFLDVECRIVAPIPEHWRPPLVSIRSPAQRFWIRYNSGTVMADGSCLPWLDAWLHIIDAWRLAELAPEHYIEWPGDINDELALGASLAALGVAVRTPRLEYVDRNADAEIARGLWRSPHTILQHPTLHHWAGETDAEECKKLFWQNFAGDPVPVAELFRRPQGVIACDDWVFDTDRRLYAPRSQWPAAARPWTDDAVTLTSAQR